MTATTRAPRSASSPFTRKEIAAFKATVAAAHTRRQAAEIADAVALRVCMACPTPENEAAKEAAHGEDWAAWVNWMIVIQSVPSAAEIDTSYSYPSVARFQAAIEAVGIVF